MAPVPSDLPADHPPVPKGAAACPFSRQSVEIVESTVPILETGGETLTRAFYKRMHANDPVVKNFFNQAHQVSGQQPRALANSVLAYAKNLRSLGNLGEAVEIIAQKHVALDIKAPDYEIVGRNLLGAMVDVLGEETATPEVIAAWAEAYGFLADVLIKREQAIYDELAAQPGGWNGRREFVVAAKEVAGQHASVTFKPVEGELPLHKPGQYLTLYPTDTLSPSTPRPLAPRNYSISSTPGADGLRITVKRERAEGKPDGLYSNWIHDVLQVGDRVELGPPVGQFFLDNEAVANRPAWVSPSATTAPRSDPFHRVRSIFVSGGIGLTPLLPMLKSAAASHPSQRLAWAYACPSSAQHAAVELEAAAVAKSSANVVRFTAYDEALPSDQPDVRGRFVPADLLRMAGMDAAEVDVYVCGPQAFMAEQVSGFRKAGVPEARVHYEFFGPLGSVEA
ncbi:oxidoreductase FAD/NAD(P)-binding domain protein [Hyaloraphidium curvatum]|nr:oxidoreductase FAD/NAD(P)-binding domain protein [Hyaloraphidium curvatum]